MAPDIGSWRYPKPVPKGSSCMAWRLLFRVSRARAPRWNFSDRSRRRYSKAADNSYRLGPQLPCFPPQNRADFSFLQIQRQSEYSIWKFDHLVKHHVAQPLNARDSIARFTHNADVAFGCRCF